MITEPWKRGEWKDIDLRSLRASDNTEASVLGQNDKVYEYSQVVPKTTWKQDAGGLHIRAMFAQRLQDNSKWPNPIVVKITHVKPGLEPPRIETSSAKRDAGGVVLQGALESLGDAKSVEVGFEYRSLKGLDTNERSGAWTTVSSGQRQAPGVFNAQVAGWEKGEPYEYRAFVKHPLLTMYGDAKKTRLP